MLAPPAPSPAYTAPFYRRHTILPSPHDDIIKRQAPVAAKKNLTHFTMPRRRRGTQKGGMQHEDCPGGHPSEYYSRPSTLNFGVLMGSGALVLV